MLITSNLASGRVLRDLSPSPTGKIDAATRTLRADIVAGRFPPGSRLPPFAALEKRLGATRTVVQGAVERLRRDGFVRTVARSGAFVEDAPPHLSRYALVFPDHPGATGWSRFSSALAEECARLRSASPALDIDLIRDAALLPDGPDMARLMSDAASERLAGVILAPGTHGVASLLAAIQGIPAVFVAPGDTVEGPCVRHDLASLHRRALQALAAEGCRRVAAIALADSMGEGAERSYFHDAGLEWRPQWFQRVGREAVECAANLVRLLMDYPERKRPDGLFIVDDNLVEPVSAGLVAAGILPDRDLRVVAHCNWPWPVPSVLPIRRIGFDVADVLRRSLDVIDAIRTGTAPIRDQRVPALFEEEVGLT